MSNKPDRKRITHQFLRVVKISQETPFNRIFVPVLLAIGIVYSGIQLLQGDTLGALLPGFSVVLLLVLATNTALQRRLMGEAFGYRHALYIALFWGYTLLWITLLRMLDTAPSTGKQSQFFYVLLIMFAALNQRMALTLFMLTRRGSRLFITALPLWEQALVAFNEVLAVGLLAYVGGGFLAQALQPNVFTLQFNPLYVVGALFVMSAYYIGTQLMWLSRWNAWLSRNEIWVGLARLFAPAALLLLTLEITRRFNRLSDPRTVDLLGGKEFDLAVLALTPVVWLVIFVIILLVYTSRRGLRQRLLPDELLEQFPAGLKRFFSSVSDMDILLILAVLATSIPAHLILLDDSRVGFLDSLRQQIFQQGSALLETSEQALSLLFTIPFYCFLVLLLGLYAYVMSRSSLSAEKRNELVALLPNGSLIILIITLYLFAIPLTNVLTSGRLPRLPQDLGSIMVFYVLIPLVLLYFHYFLLVRLPYVRGQSRWRAHTEAVIRAQLVTTENSIGYLSERIKQLETDWLDNRVTETPETFSRRLDILYHYVEINSERDTLNMNKLRVLSELQALNNDQMEVPLAIAKLPGRVVRYGIPLLLAINIYQWAIVGDGLKEIANNPNISVVEFFRIILQQTQF